MIWKGHLLGKEKCFNKGIYDSDPRFSGKFFSNKYSKTIDKIVKVNKMKRKFYFPKKIKK